MPDHPADLFSPAFAFTVAFHRDTLAPDAAFMEVSGLDLEMQVEKVKEGGENRFEHQLPGRVTHGALVLKRGIGAASSGLVKWCKATLEGGLGTPIVPASLTVSLVGADGQPLRSWIVASAYPTKWAVAAFDAQKNEVAIETVELAYTYSRRLR